MTPRSRQDFRTFRARGAAPRGGGRTRIALLAALLAGPCAALHADTVEERLERRDFPSVFQAWSPVQGTGEGELDAAARHDLLWRTIQAYGLQWDGPIRGRATAFDPASVERALAKRAALLARNPDMVLLAQLRYWAGTPDRPNAPGLLPEDDPWWLREGGELVSIYPEFDAFRLDLGNAEYRASIVERARALVDTGVVDGIMLDSWNDFDFPEARTALLRDIRAAIGEALIVVNANAAKPERAAPYVNGLFMEVGDAADTASWANYRDIMGWAETELRRPAFTAFETWRVLETPEDDARDDPPDLRRMRATTALSLVGSDGFALFADPNYILDGSDHLHDWYAFWDVGLGRPTGPAIDLVGGAVRRDYEEGVALYSPPGGTTGTVEFDAPVRSASTGRVSDSHPIGPFDGDLFLFTEAGPGDDPDPAADVEAAVGDFAPPARIGAGDRVRVSVAYESEAPVDLVLSLQDTANGWRPAGFARVAVPAGSSSVDLDIDVAGDAVPGAAYAWTAWIAPPGGGWPERLDAATVDAVELVAAGTAFADGLGELGAVGTLRAGERFEVEVGYAAAGERTVNVSLQDTATGWSTRGFARVDVPPGSGVASLAVEIRADAPAGGEYTLGAYLTPRGGQWPERLDDVRVNGLTVTAR